MIVIYFCFNLLLRNTIYLNNFQIIFCPHCELYRTVSVHFLICTRNSTEWKNKNKKGWKLFFDLVWSLITKSQTFDRQPLNSLHLWMKVICTHVSCWPGVPCYFLSRLCCVNICFLNINMSCYIRMLILILDFCMFRVFLPSNNIK